MRTRSLLTALVLFLFAFAVRRYFYCGLVLGDDGQEYALMLHVLSRGPDFHDQYHLRFGVWIFNYLSFFLFGISEWSLMLPNWALSSVLGIVAYALLRRWGYDQLQAFLGGLFVVSAPFEVLAGTLRVNDLFLGLAMALGLWALVRFEERPLLQGLAVALCLWFGFYVKLWAVYVLPALGVYYLAERRWRGLAAVTVASLVIHGATCAFWHAKVGSYLPFIEAHAVNWAVPRDRLVEVFLTYPKLIFQGSSEFGTTLFGAVPYLLLALLLVKVLATALRVPASSPLRLDRADRMLLVLWGSFFLLLDFFPNGFQFDAYYSVPRIFRYITPMSFPMTLHAAKLLLDVTRRPGRRPPRSRCSCPPSCSTSFRPTRPPSRARSTAAPSWPCCTTSRRRGRRSSWPRRWWRATSATSTSTRRRTAPTSSSSTTPTRRRSTRPGYARTSRRCRRAPCW